MAPIDPDGTPDAAYWKMPAPAPDDFEARARARASECTFELFGTTVHVEVKRDARNDGGRLYYQAVCPSRPDAFTGLPSEGRGGKAYLSPAMIDDELVQLCWGLLEGYVHHEAREGFRWRGKQIYGPHMKVANLAAIADDIAVRPPADASPEQPAAPAQTCTCGGWKSPPDWPAAHIAPCPLADSAVNDG